MNPDYLFFIAAQDASGQTTIACNLGAAMKEQGRKPLVVSLYENQRLLFWNDIPSVSCPPAENRETIVPGKGKLPDFLIFPFEKESSFARLPKILSTLAYDCFLILTGNTFAHFPASLPETIPPKSHFLLCTTLENPDDSHIIQDFLLTFRQKTGREIDLLIPNKLQVREWENNSRQLMELGEELGYEKMVDMLPECSRIRELPLDHKTVWEVPVDQMRFAFTKLLEQIEAF